MSEFNPLFEDDTPDSPQKDSTSEEKTPETKNSEEIEEEIKTKTVNGVTVRVEDDDEEQELTYRQQLIRFVFIVSFIVFVLAILGWFIWSLIPTVEALFNSVSSGTF